MWLLGWMWLLSLGFCTGGSSNFQTGETNFSLSLYKAAFDPDRNIIVAPFVLRNSVTMLYAIATGTTRDRLREVFELPVNHTEFLANQKQLLHSLERAGHGFHMKNRLILNGYRDVFQDVRNVMKNSLDTTIAYFDFGQQEGILRRVNHFVNFNTKRVVTSMVELEDIPKQLQLLQMCAATFRPPFAFTFDPNDTSPRDFRYGLVEKLYTTMTLFTRGSFRFSRLPELEIEVLELPFVKSSDAAMWIILPDLGTPLERLTKILVPEHFNTIRRNFVRLDAEVTMPLFQIESDFNATSFLRDSMGLDSLFKFRELRIFNDYYSSLDSFMHRAGMRFYEKSAYGGGASVMRGFTRRSALHQFLVQRSYIFVIVQRGHILFMGHLLKPEDLVEA